MKGESRDKQKTQFFSLVMLNRILSDLKITKGECKGMQRFGFVVKISALVAIGITFLGIYGLVLIKNCNFE